MTNLILTKPIGGGGGNAFETILTDAGSITAISPDDILIIAGGIAIDTSVSGSPNAVTINVDPSQIDLGELGDVTIGSPTPTGYVLAFNGTGWTPTDPGGLSLGIVGGPGIDVTTTGSPAVSTISLNICSVTAHGSPNTLSLDDTIAVCDGGSTLQYSLQELSDTIVGPLNFYNTITDGTNTATAGGANTIEFVAGDGINVVVANGTDSPQENDTVTVSVDGGLQLSIINGQPVMTYLDETRNTGSPTGSPVTGKRLSVSDQVLIFSENRLTTDDWLEIGNAVDTDSGYIMDLDGTVTFATGHCENTNANSKDIHLFVNGTDKGSIGTLSGGGDVQFINTTIDVDFSQGDKIRLQAQGAGGAILDTVVKISVKWRG